MVKINSHRKNSKLIIINLEENMTRGVTQFSGKLCPLVNCVTLADHIGMQYTNKSTILLPDNHKITNQLLCLTQLIQLKEHVSVALLLILIPILIFITT